MGLECCAAPTPWRFVCRVFICFFFLIRGVLPGFVYCFFCFLSPEPAFPASSGPKNVESKVVISFLSLAKACLSESDADIPGKSFKKFLLLWELPDLLSHGVSGKRRAP